MAQDNNLKTNQEKAKIYFSKKKKKKGEIFINGTKIKTKIKLFVDFFDLYIV